jgi:hypothetical protein
MRSRITNWQPWKTSVIEAVLLSTRPAARPYSCTSVKVRSVCTPEAFLGQPTQRRPAGSSARWSEPNRRANTLRWVVNSTATSMPFVARARKSTSGGSGACRRSRSSNPGGAPTSTTRDPWRMPSFFHSGVPE